MTRSMRAHSMAGGEYNPFCSLCIHKGDKYQPHSVVGSVRIQTLRARVLQLQERLGSPAILGLMLDGFDGTAATGSAA